MHLVNLHRFSYFPTGHTLLKALERNEENIDAKVFVRPGGIAVIIQTFQIHAELFSRVPCSGAGRKPAI